MGAPIPFLYPIALGMWDGGSTYARNTGALNAAATWKAYGFKLPKDETISKVSVYVTGVTGTLGANDLTASIYSDNAGVPNTSLSSTNTVTTTPTGALRVEFTGLSQAVTADTQYWIVIKNVNASPASNFATLSWVANNINHSYFGVNTGAGFCVKGTVDSGTNWATGNNAAVAGLRIECSSGNFYGLPADNAGTGGVAIGIYSTREYGAKFTTPANANLRVIAIGARTSLIGTPTGLGRFRLYQGTSLVATTNSADRNVTSSFMIMSFSSVQVLSPSTVYRIVMGETTQSDTSGNRIVLGILNIDNTANSKALLPLGGWAGTYFDGSSWTDDDTVAPCIWMILDSSQPF